MVYAWFTNCFLTLRSSKSCQRSGVQPKSSKYFGNSQASAYRTRRVFLILKTTVWLRDYFDNTLIFGLNKGNRRRQEGDVEWVTFLEMSIMDKYLSICIVSDWIVFYHRDHLLLKHIFDCSDFMSVYCRREENWNFTRRYH